MDHIPTHILGELLFQWGAVFLRCIHQRYYMKQYTVIFYTCSITEIPCLDEMYFSCYTFGTE